MTNLKPREELILGSIIRQYVERAVPVSSSSILEESCLDISSATVRNDVARLEDEGYILHPHHAAGSVPSDMGYRHHVSALGDVALPLQEQFLIKHLFHQVEDRLEEWLNLAATLLAQHTRNVAVVTTPRPAASRFKHLELVAIQPRLALAVLVLHGAKIRQQLINLDSDASQDELSRLSQQLNGLCDGLNTRQIQARLEGLGQPQQRLVEHIHHLMQAEDEHTGQGIFLDGWHFLLAQPEFSSGQRLVDLMGLVEQRQLARVMPAEGMDAGSVQVVIGKENQTEAIRDCSLVVGHYGLPEEALGSVAVVGPTRMAYEHTISVIKYISSLISLLIAELYGVAPPGGEAQTGS